MTPVEPARQKGLEICLRSYFSESCRYMRQLRSWRKPSGEKGWSIPARLESRSLAARGAYRAVERRLLTLSRFFSLGRGEVSDESQGALPGLWEYGKYYPAPETSLGPGELDDIIAGVSRLFEAQNSLFEIGFARGCQSGQGVPANIGRSVMHNLERGIELLSRFCPQPEADVPQTPEDDSAWVTAATLWHDRFTTIKEVHNFRADHPEMFRNPSPYKLQIHAAKWATYWASRQKAGFEALDDNSQSIADDPNVQDETLLGAAERIAELRAKKRAGKQ